MATPDAAPSSRSVPTRGWAVDSKDTPIRVKPRRPYTPYNLFYLLERELVVQGHDPATAQDKTTKRAKLLIERKATHGDRAEDEIPVPARYKGVVLLPMWYEPNLKEKRKHRKTHGKISFKDLTEIISKNWSTIDAETKDYCTRISEMGRKLYKETMSRYNASQKILQLKEEHAAMENARENRIEQFKKKDCNSPSRRGKVKSNPTTPDRISSRHAPIVTPTSGGYSSNRVPMFVPSGAHAAFHQYGPPPPLPPPMPHSHSHSMQGQHHPMQGQHHPMQGQHHPMHGQLPPLMPMYHHHPQYAYPQPPPMPDKMRVLKSNNRRQSNEHQYRHHNGGNFFNLPGGPGVDVNVNVNVCVKNKDDASTGASSQGNSSHGNRSEKSNMTHEDAMQLYSHLHTPGMNRHSDYAAPLNDTLLQEMPSFDFGDHHSLSTEDGDTNSECVVDGILGQVEDHLDLIRGDHLLPLELGEDNAFPDIMFQH